MAVVEELLRGENGRAISFGNHKLKEKAKLVDFEFGGDLWKVKTYKTMTKLEKNGMFVYESVPGTSVNRFTETQDGINFTVEGSGDAQVTVGLQDETEYEVFINNESIGKMRTNLGGKLNLSVELSETEEVDVRIEK